MSEVVNKATTALYNKDFSQPIKPYLRYKDLTNRIIAMPAFLGGEFAIAGIKWIASFPGNLNKNIPRAHSIIILNEESTGKPLSVINTPLLSGIRTAGVTGTMIAKYFAVLPPSGKKTFGIIGLGPIGLLHLEMIDSLFGHLAREILIYDLKPPEQWEIPGTIKSCIRPCLNWEEVFDEADILVTCTVSKERYIHKKPAPGSLHLNVSLRDYAPEFLQYVDKMIVDDWEEVCRENTDVEKMHQMLGLNKEDTVSIGDVMCNGALNDVTREDVIMFNPMGMAIFDVAIAKFFYDQAVTKGVGLVLED